MANKQALNALVILELLDSEDEEGDNKNGRGKTREWLKRRRELGYYTNIVQELLLEDTKGFKEMMRMDYKYFKEILNLVEPDITPQEIIGGNKGISAAERLTLTLRFLATGETFQSMRFQFRISDRTISYIVKDVCDAIEAWNLYRYQSSTGHALAPGLRPLYHLNLLGNKYCG